MQLKRTSVPPNDQVLFYITDYAIPAFYHVFPQYLKKELLHLEERAISIIVPGASYNTGMEDLGF